MLSVVAGTRQRWRVGTRSCPVVLARRTTRRTATHAPVPGCGPGACGLMLPAGLRARGSGRVRTALPASGLTRVSPEPASRLRLAAPPKSLVSFRRTISVKALPLPWGRTPQAYVQGAPGAAAHVLAAAETDRLKGALVPAAGGVKVPDAYGRVTAYWAPVIMVP